MAGKRLAVGKEGLVQFFMEIARVHPDPGELFFAAIGTDRSTGDAYGPLVGTMLKEQGWMHVAGTLDRPLDADRLAAEIACMPRDKTIIAIDACLAGELDVGGYYASFGGLCPAEAVGKKFEPLGSYSVAGVVGRRSVKPYWALQSAPLSLVLEMARDTAGAIVNAWPGMHQDIKNWRLFQ